MKYVFLLCLALSIFSSGCKSENSPQKSDSTPVENNGTGLKNQKVQDFLNATMNAHGGEENYTALGSINWSQKVNLFDSSGVAQKEKKEFGYINFRESLMGNITWLDSSLLHRIDYIQAKTTYYINGYQSNVPELDQKAGASYFVTYSSVFAPFNLRSFQLKLAHKGKVTLGDYGELTLIEGVNPIEGLMSNGSSKLRYYFNSKNEYVAMEMESDGQIVRMFHEGLVKYKGLRLPKKTTNYLVDVNQEEPLKLSEIVYNYGEK